MLKSIQEQVESEITIKKSRFIGILIPVSDVQEVALYLEECKERYPSASHYCYAYCIDGAIKASDDGEPAKTAGMPILNVLQKNELNHVLAVVIRYFGGIKLGAGGLVRAYSQSIVETLGQAKIVKKQRAPYYRLSFDYHLMRQIDYLCKSHGIEISYKDFQEKVTYEAFIIDKKIVEEIEERFFNQMTITCLRYDDIEVKEDVSVE